jgi:hypothetical protein
MRDVYIIWIDGDVIASGPADPGGDGWGGGVIPTDTQENITVYAWKRDPSVTFSTLHETIIVDPRGYDADTAGAQACADDISAEVTALQGAGFKAGLRYWYEVNVGDENIFEDAWFEGLEAYSNISLDTATTDWWAAFNARMTSNGVTPDYKIHDYEDGMAYSQFPSESVRRTVLEPITIDDSNNPYPNDPNPYIGENIWEFSDALRPQFSQEWDQYAVEQRTNILKSISEDCPVATTGGQQNYSNYEDYLQSYEIGSLFRNEDLIPIAQTRLSDISSPKVYLDYVTTQILTNPEPEYTSTRQKINRRRWKKFLWSHNKAKSALAAGSRCHPWIAPPGYGYSGANSWCNTTQLPFEKFLWRVKMRHLRALGIDTFILWNPTDTYNPNAADTDAFMDAYFTDLAVRDVNSVVGLTPMSADTIVTNDRITAYNDVYRIRYLYWQKSSTSIEPFSQGFGTAAEPLILNPGATGDAELAAFLAAMEEVYGDEDTGGDDYYQVPSDYEMSGIEPAPE